MKDMFKDAIILFVITLVAGLSLGVVYNVTKTPRAKQEQNAKNEAYKAVFAEAADFEEYSLDEKTAKEIANYIVAADTEDVKSNGATNINATVDEIMIAKDESGNKLGYVITVTDNEAYDGNIQFSVGITNDKTVKGISYLSISETPGLGMKAKEESFMNQYKDKNVDFFQYSKTGKTADNEIDAISGATITSNAVTNGVNAAIFCFDYITGGDSNE